MFRFGRKLEPRHAEKATGFGEDVAELDQTAAFPDNVEQIPVLAGCRVSPLAGGALPRCRPAQLNEHRPAGGIASVSDNPVSADTPTIGEIVAADKFDLFGKPAGEIRCLD